MSELEVEVSLGRIRAIPATNPANGTVLLSGPGEIMGWSFRESGAETGLEAEGSVTSPAAGGAIVTVSNVPIGVYTVSWSVELSGTLAAGDANNFVVKVGATSVMVSLNGIAAGNYPQTSFQVSLNSLQNITVNAVAVGTVGAVYSAQISVTPVTAGQAVLELRDGNNALCEISAGIAGSLTQWFGPEGIRFYNQIQCVPIVGQMTGAVYARFGRARGWT